MRLYEIYQNENVVKLNTEPKLDKLPHEEVESVIHRWVNQDDHIELSNGMHVLSGENHGYPDNMALIIDQDYKIVDKDDDIVDLMQQFTAQEIDPSIVDPNEVGLLEDLIAAAVNDARSKVDGKVAEKMQEVSGGITLPPGFNLPF